MDFFSGFSDISGIDILDFPAQLLSKSNAIKLQKAKSVAIRDVQHIQ